MMSGVLLAVAMYAIVRWKVVVDAALGPSFTNTLLTAAGLLSLFVGTFSLVIQRHYKRMLAYSSVEHMGIVALGVGIGGAAVFGAMLHALCHAFAKAALFLIAGNLLARYGSKRAGEVRGALEAQPASAVLWIAGLLAITGMPPFPLFLSEFTILREALAVEPWMAGGFLFLLAIAFVAMFDVGLPMALGRAPATISREPEPASALVSPAILAVLLLALGLVLPAPILGLIEGATRAIGGG
jgi:hydrogenase-4 component F